MKFSMWQRGGMRWSSGALPAQTILGFHESLVLCPLGSALLTLLTLVTAGGSVVLRECSDAFCCPSQSRAVSGFKPSTLCKCGAVQHLLVPCHTGTGWLPVFRNGHENAEGSWAKVEGFP